MHWNIYMYFSRDGFQCNEGISLLEKIKKINLSTTPDIINQYRAGPGPLKLDKLTFDYGLTF